MWSLAVQAWPALEEGTESLPRAPSAVREMQGHRKLFWDLTNWQPLCKSCHSRHKQREERRGYSSSVGPDGWPIDPRHPANR